MSIVAYMFCKEYSYLNWFDIDMMGQVLHKQISSIPEKEPGYHLKEFEVQFDEYWEAKKKGMKVKRKPLVFEDEDLNTEATNRSKTVSKSKLDDVFVNTAKRKSKVEE